MSKLIVLVVILLLLAAAAAGGLAALSSHSQIAFQPTPAVIGTSTPVAIKIENPHGVQELSLAIEQNGVSMPLPGGVNEKKNYFKFWKEHKPGQTVTFNAGKKEAPELKEGSAKIVATVRSNDFRGSVDTISTDVRVILRPPTVTADEFQHYINQGGSELAIFTPSGSWDEAGVKVGDKTYKSFPMPGNPNQRISLFVYPWDLPPGTAPVVYAKNAAGNEGTAHFWFKVFPKKFRSRDLIIDDAFLNKVVNQIDTNGSGDLVPRFLKINGDLRKENNKTLADLRLKTADHFLWKEAFMQLANSKVEAEFADVRTYVYKGQKIDKQVHLGFDLAVGQHTPVVAANDGKVVWAAMLGIYGNCIVVDHGLGLQSIYGHLSELDVKEGDMVTRGQSMGKSGSTGLAGGDHLHFSMQVDGVQVNPIEWWDPHWIKDHVAERGLQ